MMRPEYEYYVDSDRIFDIQNPEQRYMETGEGMYYYPLIPVYSDPPDIGMIAASLAKTARFNGHGKFYSVAEHSCIMADISNYPFTALMHDAPEAFLGDVIRPVKVLLNKFKYCEELCFEYLADYYREHFLYPLPDEVERLDNLMVYNEGIKMGKRVENWGFKDKDCIENNPSLQKRIKFWDYKKAEKEFIKRFNRLF